jgi:hypothetical protein
VLADIAAFTPGEAGGSIVWDLDFASNYDTTFAELCLKAFTAGALPLDATLTVLATGKLPEEFDAEDIALRMMADAQDDANPDAIDGGSDAPPSKTKTKSTKKIPADPSSTPEVTP